jgi:hypothetical protein
MKIPLKKDEDRKPFELCPAGTFAAVVYRVVDIGTHPVTGQYALDEKGNQKFKRTLDICWEIPGELMTDGRPFAVFRNLPASLHEKSGLFKLLKPWLGAKALEDFDTNDLVGKGCLLSVEHSQGKQDPTKTWANVGGVLPLPKGMPVPVPTNPAFAFSIDNWDDELFNQLSKFTQDKIKDSIEYKARMLNQADAGASPVDSDFPF